MANDDKLEDMDFEEVEGIPNLSVLKPAYQQPTVVPLCRQISLFKSEQGVKTVHHHEHQQQRQQQQQRQTNQPVSPPEEPMSTDSDPTAAGDDCEARAPGLEWLDNCPEVATGTCLDLNRPLVPLSPAEISTCLEPDCPSPPEVMDEGARIQLTVVMQARQRSDTITLVSADSTALSASPGSAGRCDWDSDVLTELMQCEDDDSVMLPLPTQPEFKASPRRRTASDTSQSAAPCDIWIRTANHILQMHQKFAKTVPIPKAKQKPMLHEFLGYVIFCADTDPGLAALRDGVYFCDEFGQRLREQAPSKFFHVANFNGVSAVWRIIKNNNSEDCAKNMKRAMRMSTSNKRDYFVNLNQRKHRMQVFMFGDKSRDFFRLVFPHGLQQPAAALGFSA